MTQKPKIRLRDICVRAVQAVGWLLLRPLLKFFIRYRYHSQIDLKKIKTPVIVIANHFSNLDPVIVGTILPFGSTIYPIYFIAKDTLLTVPILGGFLKLCGAFRAHKKEGYEKSLAEPKKILANGHSIMIFPQGHRYREFRIDQGRTGTAMLALESGRPVLPIAICGVNGFSWKNVFFAPVSG